MNYRNSEENSSEFLGNVSSLHHARTVMQVKKCNIEHTIVCHLHQNTPVTLWRRVTHYGVIDYIEETKVITMHIV